MGKIKTYFVSPVYSIGVKAISKNEEVKLGFDEQKRKEKDIKEGYKKLKKRGGKKQVKSNEEIEKIAYETWRQWSSSQPKEQVLEIKRCLLKNNQLYWKTFKSSIQDGSNPTNALLKVIVDCYRRGKI
jgi:hypothetical protein